MQVPADAASAFAPAGLSVDTYNKYKAHMDKLHVKDKEVDWQHADSLLFNSFILLQVGRAGDPGATTSLMPAVPGVLSLQSVKCLRLSGQQQQQQP
jgi:hypothetical protein